MIIRDIVIFSFLQDSHWNKSPIAIHDMLSDEGFRKGLYQSYNDFKNILNRDLTDDDIEACEQIIKWITIYAVKLREP